MNWFSIGLRVVRSWPDIQRLYEMLRPIIAMLKKVAPEAVPLAQKIIKDVAPEVLDGVAATTEAKIDVRWIQESLNRLDGEKLTVDGKYGNATRDAVKRWQAKRGLTVDGWAGFDTISDLHKETDK